MKLDTLMWLLLVVFMLHDFEEIIMMKPWMRKNADELRRRFPSLGSRILSFGEGLSTPAYALAISIIFLSLSAAIGISVETGNYALWTAVFLVLAVHWVAHIVSYLVYRRYVPVIITSVMSVPYCVYVVQYLNSHAVDYSAGLVKYLVWTVVLGLLIFVGAMWAAGRFQSWLDAHYGQIA